MKDTAIFTSSIFASELLPKLLSVNRFPQIFTYLSTPHRKTMQLELTNYRDFFKITYLTSNKFSENKPLIEKSNFTKAIMIDFSKDFFDMTHPYEVFFMQPSLLPMYRGYGAISEQFLRGVCIGGITFYIPNEITDAGDIVYQKEIEITFEDYPSDYIEKLSTEIISFIEIVGKNTLTKWKQDERYAFSTSRVRRKIGLIDFRADALSVYNHIRAYSRPFFGAFCYLSDEKITIFRAKPEKWQGKYGIPGEVISTGKNGIEVACGSGTIIIYDIESENETVLKEGLILNKTY